MLRRLLPVLLLALAGCGATESASSPTDGGEPQTATAAPSTSAAPSPASGLERLCAAFDIVTGEISPAYDALADDGSDINVQLQGLAIMVAGSEIIDLADGVLEPSFVEILERMGEGYIAEGEAVSDGNLSGTEAVSYYLDQVVEYGQECP